MNTNITNYIPHRQKMVLIDNIIDESEDNFKVEVLSSKKSLLATAEGIPAFCAIEYMAQSISAYNKIYAMSGVSSVVPRIGFIIAIRKFKCELDYLPLNERFIISIDPILVVNSSGSFNCSLAIGSKVIATSKITAYEPSDAELERFKQDGNHG